MEVAPRIIALLNQKGGVGKTTTTVNIGAAMARRGQRILLVDLDPQAHLTLHLGVDADADEPVSELSIYDLLLNPAENADAAVSHVDERLDVIRSEVDLAAVETELAAAPDRYTRLADHLRRVADRYDVILLDCPPSLGLLTINALACAREVIIPMQAHFLALQGVGKLLETVSMMASRVNPLLRVTGVILCMHESTTRLAQEVVADLEAFFEQNRSQPVPWRDARILRPHVRRNIKLAESPSFGKSIFDYEPTCPGAQDYAALAATVLALHASSPAPPDEPEVCITVQAVQPATEAAPDPA